MKALKDIFAFFNQIFTFKSSTSGQFGEHPELQSMTLYVTDRSRFRKLMKRAYSTLESELTLLKRRALNLGLKNKDAAPNVPTQALKTWEAVVERAGSPAINAMEAEISDLSQNLTVTDQKLAKPIEDVVSELNQKMRPELDRSMLAFLEKEKSDTTDLQEGIASLEKDITDYESAKIGALDNLRNKVPIEGFMDAITAFLVFLGVILTVEYHTIMAVFDALRIGPNIATCISLALSALIAFSASWMAHGVVNSSRFNLFLGFLVGLASIGAIAMLRFMGTEMASDATNLDAKAQTIYELDYFFLLLNALFWLFAFVFETNRQKRQAYFIPAKRLEKAVRERAKLQKQFNKVSAVDNKGEESIRNKYQSKILEEAYGKRDRLAAQKAELESLLQTRSDEMKMFKNNLHLIEEYGATLFRENFQKGVQNRRPNINGFQFNCIILLLAMMLGLGSGCGTAEEMITGSPEHIEVWMVDDDTMKPHLQNEVNFDKFPQYLSEEIMHLDLEDPPRTKVDIYYAILNELVAPPIAKVTSLPEGDYLYRRPEWDRRDSIIVFEKKLGDFIENKFGKSAGMNTSQVNHCLCRSLNKLSASSATKKYMFIYSDLMENTPGLSFHGDNAPDISGKDYEMVAKMFTEACPLKDLSGIQIQVVFSPRKINQNEVIKAQDFWKKYLEHHSATVEFRPNF